MSGFVVDNSVVMSWAFDDETSEYADAVLDSLAENCAFVPPLWPAEVANVLVVAERRGRLAMGDTLRFLALLRGLPIQVVPGDVISLPELASLAREFGLSAYDASYLRLAIDSGVPIATLDVRLRNAASRAGVALWLPERGA